jgi:hypothetical protein
MCLVMGTWLEDLNLSPRIFTQRINLNTPLHGGETEINTPGKEAVEASKPRGLAFVLP